MSAPAWLGSPAVAELVRLALAEDAVEDDVTSAATVPAAARAVGTIVAKQAGRIAGLPLLAPESPLVRPFPGLEARALVDAGADAVAGDGVGAPLVGGKGGEILGPAGRNHAHEREGVVEGAHPDLAEAAAEIDPGFVDLVVVGLAGQLDPRADFKAVVEDSRTGETHLGILEEAVGVPLVSGLAFLVIIERCHIGGVELPANVQLDAVSTNSAGDERAQQHSGTGDGSAHPVPPRTTRGFIIAYRRASLYSSVLRSARFTSL